MKNLIRNFIFPALALTLGLFIAANGMAQQHEKVIKSTFKSFKKLNDTLAVSQFEVSNQQYRTFLENSAQNGNEGAVKYFYIDSNQWAGARFYMKPYVKYYHSHVAYNHYPVVNISYEGATAYCNWLTEIYNADPKRKYKSVVFRLPTEKEWEFAAAGGVENAEYSWSPDTVWTMKKGFRANFKSHGNINITSAINDNADITAPVDSYWPNNYGLYNMCGNVAEMALEEGIIKGGGFMDDIEKLKISSRETFPPECYACSDIGFRPVMIILEP